MTEMGSDDHRRTGRRGVHAVRARLPAVVWLTLVWVLLWGTFTLLSIVGGVLVAVLVSALFRMPPLPDRLPVRPLPLLGLVAFLLYDLVASGVEVSWQILRHGPRAQGTIVAVPLLSGSDRVVTVLANAVSLSPGAMVLQIDHERETWYIYALGPRDRDGAERARLRAMDVQRRVLAALGRPEELAEAQRRIAEAGARR
jgi:multicomponent Na+:H+ antiporter subunit E